MTSSPARTVQGHCDARFTAVKTQLQEFLTSGRELGASICVNLHGTNVIDIWGGHADAAQTQPWTKDTITTIWSITKNITVLAALVLIDRKILDPDAPVSKYWPEFNNNGKHSILVRHFLSHSSGISGWDQKISPETMLDLPASTRLLAQQEPFWPPGTASGYHAMNLGHLIGQLVLRTTNKSLQDFIHDEIVAPLGADFSLGALEKDWHRIAEIVPPPPSTFPHDMDPNHPMLKTLQNPVLTAAIANTEAWRRGVLGSANGYGNARSVCKILSAISLKGTVDGVRLLAPETVDAIFEEQVVGLDLVLGKTVRFGLGFAISSLANDVELPNWVPASERIATWGGWGGSMSVMDVERGLTIVYVMNRMEDIVVTATEEEETERGRLREYVCGVYEALGVTV